jgi:UDP-glucose 6-dehydrogenase
MVDAITVDPRIGRSHTQVPGPDGKFGYGGHCLPKDMAALRFLSKKTPLLDSIVDINEKFRDE